MDHAKPLPDPEIRCRVCSHAAGPKVGPSPASRDRIVLVTEESRSRERSACLSELYIKAWKELGI